MRKVILILLALALTVGIYMFLLKNSSCQESSKIYRVAYKENKKPSSGEQNKTLKILHPGENKCYFGIFMGTCWVNYSWKDYKNSWHEKGFTGNYNYADGSTQEIYGFRDKIGRFPAIVHRGTYWDKDPWNSSKDKPFTNPLHGNFNPSFKGVVWCAIWSPPIFSPGNSTHQIKKWLEEVSSGAEDSVIIKAARDAIAYRNPLMIELAVEINSSNPAVHNKIPPEDYKRFHRRVVDIFRNEFRKAKAVDNVTWCLYGGHETTYGSLKEYYPGDNYVDWIGKSIYDGKSVHKLEMFGKPVYAPEYLPKNSGEGNGKADCYLKEDLEKTNFQAICLNVFDWTMACYIPGENYYHYREMGNSISQHKDYLELSRNEYDYLKKYLLKNKKFLSECRVVNRY
ncbi:MAG: glycosyl hydrolase [bacterium]|nr:glycosyl hydrolase [bacterium]